MQFSPIDSSGASPDYACIAVAGRDEYPRDSELAPSSLLLLLYNEITRRFLYETRAHFNVGVSLAEERLYVTNHKSIFAKDPAAYLH